MSLDEPLHRIPETLGLVTDRDLAVRVVALAETIRTEVAPPGA